MKDFDFRHQSLHLTLDELMSDESGQKLNKILIGEEFEWWLDDDKGIGCYGTFTMLSKTMGVDSDGKFRIKVVAHLAPNHAILEGPESIQ